MITDLLLGLCDGLVQHEGEVLDLPLQEVVVYGEGPQGRLQTQQVQTYPCNTKRPGSANHSAGTSRLSQSQRRQASHLTCQVFVDGLHLALRSDERLLNHAVLLLFQVLHLSLQLSLSTCHLSLVDQDLKRGGADRTATTHVNTRRSCDIR